MSPSQKDVAGDGPPGQLKPADKDPVTEATTRRHVAEQAVAKASLEAAAAKAAAANAAKQQTRAEQQEKEAIAIREGVDRLRIEVFKKAKALEEIRRFREVDAVIARLELELRIAKQRAESPDASQRDADDLKTAKDRLDSEKNLHRYKKHKNAFDEATKVLEHADAVKKLIARRAVTERTQNGVKQQLALKRQAFEQLTESKNKVAEEIEALSKKHEELQQQLEALVRENKELERETAQRPRTR